MGLFDYVFAIDTAAVRHFSLNPRSMLRRMETLQYPLESLMVLDVPPFGLKDQNGLYPVMQVYDGVLHVTGSTIEDPLHLCMLTTMVLYGMHDGQISDNDRSMLSHVSYKGYYSGDTQMFQSPDHDVVGAYLRGLSHPRFARTLTITYATDSFSISYGVEDRVFMDITASSL